jgi:membrane associated rhomboid family serine protease
MQIMALPNKPPVTLGLIGLCVAMHYQASLLQGLLPGRLLFGDFGAVCLSPAAIVEGWRVTGQIDLVRLFGSALVHGDDMHLW